MTPSETDHYVFEKSLKSQSMWCDLSMGWRAVGPGSPLAIEGTERGSMFHVERFCKFDLSAFPKGT